MNQLVITIAAYLPTYLPACSRNHESNKKVLDIFSTQQQQAEEGGGWRARFEKIGHVLSEGQK